MRSLRVLILVLLGLLAAAPAMGQEVTPKSVDELTRLLQDAGVDPTQGEQAADSDRVKALRAALRAASQAAASRASAADLRGKREAAPVWRAQIDAELATQPENPTVTPAQGATLAELERQLAQADADAKSARAELATLSAEDPRRSTRLGEIPKEIAALQGEISRLEQALQAPPPTEVAPELAEARRIRLATELDAARAKVAELQAEAESYDGRKELLASRVAQAERRVTYTQGLLSEWQKVVANRRAKEAAQAAKAASERDLAAADEIDALAPIADQIRELVGELQGERAVPKRLSTATADLAETRGLLLNREELSAKLRRDVAKIGPGPNGPKLQEALRKVKDVAGYRRQLAQYQRQIIDSQYRLQFLQDLQRETSDMGKAQSELLDALGDAAEQHKDLASRLLEQRRTLAGQVRDTYENYSDTLEQLVDAYTEYIGVSEELRLFVEEYVFSVRSVRREDIVPHRADFTYDINWLFDREQWRLCAVRAASRVVPIVPPPSDTGEAERPAWHVLVLPGGAALLLVIAFLARLRLVVRSRRSLPKAGRVSHTSMLGAFYQLGLAVLAAVPVPLAVWLTSAWLYATGDVLTVLDQVPTPAPLAVASGLSRAAYVLFGLSVLRELARTGAVGTAHFRWSEAGLSYLRRHLRWFIPVATISAGIVQTFNERTNDTSTEVLGRLTLCLILLVVAVFQFLVFSPRKPMIAEYLKKHKGGLIDRAEWLWYPVLVGVPVLLAVATAAGYVYTALQVQRRVGDTFLFIMVVIVGQALVLRSLQLARRKIAIEAAKARMAAAATQPQGEGGEKKPKEADAAEVDLQAVSIQSRKVIQAATVVVLVVGLYGVWSEVLPALRWFERLQVLPQIRYLEPHSLDETVEVAEPAPTAAATTAGSSGGESAGGGTPTMPGTMLPAAQESGGDGNEEAGTLRSVTVADIGLALLLLMLTVSASRNIPGLLEIALLPRLPIDAAARYAVFTVVRYVVIIVGIVAISRALEIPWKSAQWLAAALTFGLAFGLQEIFANFVSGLIILFEQPIRVGDTVTVGTVSGTVAKVRMRATTIVDWDNKELVIPNKSFITDQIINWTLSDPITRVIVPVGIAYGSDTQLARELLLKAARASEHTLSEPAPSALFLGFGDNSLNFEIRVYIDTTKTMLIATKSDLHFLIDDAFREAGIEISFPQRDLHVRSVDAEVIKTLRGEGRQVVDGPEG